MKIQQVNPDNQSKVYALLRKAFVGSEYEARLVEQLHQNGKTVHDWVCIHAGKVIAYVCFSSAFNGQELCGLHLAPMAVAPDFQRQGVGSELLRFALRQQVIKEQPLFVLGEPDYYRRFGFEPCRQPLCPYDKNNAHFLSMRNSGQASFSVGYEAEFETAAKSGKAKDKCRRG